jgi:hypothetical protein
MMSLNAWYCDIFIDMAGGIDSESNLPVPWFAKNIWHELQWSGYVGACQNRTNQLVFGLNLEFTATWRRIRPQFHTGTLERLFSSLSNTEWHWYGRPGYPCRNSDTMILCPPMSIAEVDIPHHSIS